MNITPITVTLRQVAKNHLAQGEIRPCLKLCDARRAYLRGDDEAGSAHLETYHNMTGRIIGVPMGEAA